MKKLILKNTIVVITSDHGEIIPKVEFDVPLQTTKKLMKSVKQKIPALEPLGVKIYKKMSRNAHLKRIDHDSRDLKDEEKRTLITRGLVDLVHDDLIHIPLIIHTPDNIEKEISQLTRQIDISPTILKILNLKFDNPIDGQNLLSLTKGDGLEEEPAYIESGSNSPDKLGKFIGIRTSKFKYMRPRDDEDPQRFLFDLLDDPMESHNLANVRTTAVKYHEKILQNILTDSTSNTSYEENMEDDIQKRIESEYKKLGYL